MLRNIIVWNSSLSHPDTGLALSMVCNSCSFWNAGFLPCVRWCWIPPTTPSSFCCICSSSSNFCVFCDLLQALLSTARKLQWQLLTVLAACYPGMPLLDCLTVWLDIKENGVQTSTEERPNPDCSSCDKLLLQVWFVNGIMVFTNATKET